MKYNTLDKKTRDRFSNILRHKLQRHISKYRKNNACQKQVFIRRTLNKNLSGKYFVFINYEEIEIFGFEESMKLPVKRYAYIHGVGYSLGYKEEVDVIVTFAHSAKPFEKLTFLIESFLELEFKEITKEKYKKVQSLFEDDRKKNKKVKNYDTKKS